MASLSLMAYYLIWRSRRHYTTALALTARPFLRALVQYWKGSGHARLGLWVGRGEGSSFKGVHCLGKKFLKLDISIN